MISVRAMEPSYGLTDANTSANGKLESSMASAPTLVRMVSRSRASGRMAARSNGSERMQTMVKDKTIKSTNTDWAHEEWIIHQSMLEDALRRQ